MPQSLKEHLYCLQIGVTFFCCTFFFLFSAIFSWKSGLTKSIDTPNLCMQLLPCKCQIYLLFNMPKKKNSNKKENQLFKKRRRACGQLRHEAGSGRQLILQLLQHLKHVMFSIPFPRLTFLKTFSFFFCLLLNPFQHQVTDPTCTY